MKLVTSEQMRDIDRVAIDKAGISGPELMENAGRGVAEYILNNLIDSPAKKSVAIFCGRGNNGGDGFVIGRHLHRAEVRTIIRFIGPLDKLSEDARLNFDRVAGLGMELEEIQEVDDLPEVLENDFIIDAIFGTGFSGKPRDRESTLITYINQQPSPVISVDMPSGLNATNGKHDGAVVQASLTMTLAQPKYGLYVSPGRELAGQVRVIDIGIPEEVVSRFELVVNLPMHDEVSSMLPVRRPDGHKGTFGRLLLLAGSMGMTGAAELAAKAAMRSGCGLTRVGCPQSVQPILAAKLTESTTEPLPDVGGKGMLALRGLGKVREILSEQDAVVIGPGLGRHHETGELVRRLITGLNKPAVVDADGLNALSGNLSILKETKAPLVLTPHAGEFQRLTGNEPVADDIHKRIETAQKFATEYGVVLVLKGSPTIVADRDGQCTVNPTGNHGMATGGSGDVLSGIIGSFLAQGMKTYPAAVAAVYVHGMCGDLATAEFSARGMIAGDLIGYLPDALIELD